MAEGGETGKDISTQPVLSCGNEPVYDFYCMLCLEEGNHVEAAGYCVDCDEYMCSACSNFHRKSRLSRHHELLDSETMPRDTPIAERVDKGITTKCPRHDRKIVEYYCKNHDELGCGTCFALGHRNCSSVEKIVDRSANVLKDRDFQDFVHSLDSLSQRSRNIITKCQANASNLETSCSEAVTLVRSFIEEINTKLQKHENEILAQTNTLKAEKGKEIEQVSGNCEATLETLETMSASLQSLVENKKICEIFIFMNKDRRNIQKLKTTLDRIECKAVIDVCTFDKNTDVLESFARSNALGKLSLHQPALKKEDGGAQKTKTNIKATHVHDINVRANRDMNPCLIYGSAVLSNEKLIVADYRNKKVKLLNIQSNQILSGYKVDSSPMVITVIAQDTVAVTVQDIKKILILKISESNSIALNDEISTNGDCRGIVFINGKLIVTYAEPPKVQIMDLRGNVSMANSTIFQYPKYVCASHDGREFYVSDCGTNEVMGFKFDGTRTLTYSNLSQPQILCSGQDGQIYLCDINARHIRRITAEGGEEMIALSEKDELAFNVYSIRHCSQTNRLFVGMEADIIKVYQLQKS